MATILVTVSAKTTIGPHSGVVASSARIIGPAHSGEHIKITAGLFAFQIAARFRIIVYSSLKEIRDVVSMFWL
jgi:hypothetical protein